MSRTDDTPLQPWTRSLGYAGLVPFVGCALVMLAVPDDGSRHLAARALLGYGAVILSFLGGVHWGLVLRNAPARAAGMLAIGVVPSLLGWASLLLPFEQAAALQVAAFGGFWLYEHRVLGPELVPPAYLSLRRWLTLGVIASLGLALMAPTLVPAALAVANADRRALRYVVTAERPGGGTYFGGCSASHFIDRSTRVRPLG